MRISCRLTEMNTIKAIGARLKFCLEEQRMSVLGLKAKMDYLLCMF